MKKIKTILSIFTAVCLFCCAAVPTFALDQNDTSGTAKVVYKAGQTVTDGGTDDPSDDTVSGTYTVTIPDYILAASADEAPTQYDITAKDVLIPYNTNLKVSVEFENALKLQDNPTNTVSYDLQAKMQGKEALSSVSTGDTVLTVAAGTPDAVTTSQIVAVLTQAPVYSGIYTNTATFAMSVA